MREIIFRGQTRRYGQAVLMNGDKLPGNWVYGGIFPGTGDYSVIYGSKEETMTGPAIEKHTVYSDTVGQYTGVLDNNGVKIFEGDIVSWRRYLCIGPGVYVPGVEERFVVGFRYGYFLALDDYTDEKTGGQALVPCGDIEIKVIGNIHDNPELLKGGSI